MYENYKLMPQLVSPDIRRSPKPEVVEKLCFTQQEATLNAVGPWKAPVNKAYFTAVF